MNTQRALWHARLEGMLWHAHLIDGVAAALAAERHRAVLLARAAPAVRRAAQPLATHRLRRLLSPIVAAAPAVGSHAKPDPDNCAQARVSARTPRRGAQGGQAT